MRKFVVSVLGLMLLMSTLPGVVSAKGIAQLRILQTAQAGSEYEIYFDARNDEGKVPALKAENTSIELGDKALTPEVQTFSKTEEGMGYVFAIDTSTSLPPMQYVDSIAAISDWTSKLTDKDSAAVVSFGNDVQLRQGFTSDREALRQATVNIDNDATRTQLYKAVRFAMDIARNDDQSLPRRRAIVIVTDGEEDDGSLPFEELLAQVTETHIPIITIALDGGSNKERDKLAQIATASGGQAYTRKDDGTPKELAQQIRTFVRNTYVAKVQLDKGMDDGLPRGLRLAVKKDEMTQETRMDVRLRPLTVNAPDATFKPIELETTPEANLEGMLAASPAATAIVPPLDSERTLPSSGSLLWWVIGAVLAVGLVGLWLYLRSRSPKGAKPAMREADKLQSLKSSGDSLNLHIIETRNAKLKEHRIKLSDKLIVGRGRGADCLSVDDSAVDKVQCELLVYKGGLHVRPLSKTSQTLLNGNAIQDTQEVKSGDSIAVGGTWLTITY